MGVSLVQYGGVVMHAWQYHHLVHALQFAYPVTRWRNGWCVYQQGVFY